MRSGGIVTGYTQLKFFWQKGNQSQESLTRKHTSDIIPTYKGWGGLNPKTTLHGSCQQMTSKRLAALLALIVLSDYIKNYYMVCPYF